MNPIRAAIYIALLFSLVSQAAYATDGKSFCEGFPLAPIETMRGICIGEAPQIFRFKLDLSERRAK